LPGCKYTFLIGNSYTLNNLVPEDVISCRDFVFGLRLILNHPFAILEIGIYLGFGAWDFEIKKSD
jgi:hypothetical protein